MSMKYYEKLFIFGWLAGVVTFVLYVFITQ